MSSIVGIDMNNYDISMGTGQLRVAGGGNMTMSSSSVSNQGIYYDISGLDARTVTPNYSVAWRACTYGILTDMSGFFAFPDTTTAANQVITSPDGITWTARGGGSSTFFPWKASYGQDASGVNRIVVVGYSSSVAANSMTSSNGTTWTPVTIVNNGAFFLGVANGNGTFVAVADSGSTTYIYYSRYPSISWTAATGGPISINGWHDVTYGNDRFVAVNRFGIQSNQVAYSADGITWSYATAATSTNWSGVAYGNGLFVAVGASGNIMTSPDGITWTARTSPTTANLRRVAFGNGLFVALTTGSTTSYCVVSQDGITWSLRSAPIANFTPFGIAYGRTTNTGINRFVALHDSSANSFFTIDARNTDISSNLAKNNVFLGNDISMTDGLPAGYNWLQQNQNINGLRGICYGVPTTGSYAGQGLFVGVSENWSPFSNVRTSVDGINWVAQTTDASANTTWIAVCFGYDASGNGLFVAVSSVGTTSSIMTSSDGVNWIVRRSPNTNTLRNVAFGNGVFVAIANVGSSRVIKSTNGINWTQVSGADTYDWFGITYANNTFVITGDNGYGISTNNGDSWTLGATPVSNSWRSVTYGNGLFVAVSRTGTGNRVMTSPNGSTWTTRTSAADNTWITIKYGNGVFVATSNDGTRNRIMISQDGINWTCRNVPDYGYAAIDYGVVSSGIYAGQGIFVNSAFNSNNMLISVPGPQNNIAIGNNTTVDGVNSVAIGYGAKCTASNQIVIGSSGTNVGIGTSNPQFALDVNGQVLINSNTIPQARYSLNVRDTIQSFNTTNDVMGLFSTTYGNYLLIGSWNQQGNFSKNIVLNQFGGFVGVGTNNPTVLLDVAGSARIMDNIQMGAFSNSYRRFTVGGGNSFGYLYGAYNTLGDGIHMGYNAYNDNTSWQLNATGVGSGTSRVSMGYGYIGLYTAPEGNNPPTNLGVYQNSSGRVGIANTNPATALDVTGDITVSSQVIKPPVTYIASRSAFSLGSGTSFANINFTSPATTPTYSYFSYNVTTGVFTNVSGRTLSVLVTLNASFPATSSANGNVYRDIRIAGGIAQQNMITSTGTSSDLAAFLCCSAAANIANNGIIFGEWRQNVGLQIVGCTARITIQILN
jgi:hypothetical protein